MEVEGNLTHSLCKFSRTNQAPDLGYHTEHPTGERSVPNRVVGQRQRMFLTRLCKEEHNFGRIGPVALYLPYLPYICF